MACPPGRHGLDADERRVKVTALELPAFAFGDHRVAEEFLDLVRRPRIGFGRARARANRRSAEHRQNQCGGKKFQNLFSHVFVYLVCFIV